MISILNRRSIRSAIAFAVLALLPNMQSHTQENVPTTDKGTSILGFTPAGSAHGAPRRRRSSSKSLLPSARVNGTVT